ncbi:helix-turn-helix domain-containing protein [Salinispora arenicola]
MVERIREECRALGRQLAARRLLADLHQAELGIQVGYSRSTVASVETGRTRAHRDFWERCDHDLAAGGELIGGFRRLDMLVREYHQQLDQERSRKRNERLGQRRREIGRPTTSSRPLPETWDALPVAPVAVSTPNVCGCPLTVVRWTGCETRALREALRLTLPALAARLGLTASSVASWERKKKPANIRLINQQVLDDFLKVTDSDARVRLRAILSEQRGPEPGPGRLVHHHQCASRVSDEVGGSTPGGGVSRRRGPALVHDAGRRGVPVPR